MKKVLSLIYILFICISCTQENSFDGYIHKDTFEDCVANCEINEIYIVTDRLKNHKESLLAVDLNFWNIDDDSLYIKMENYKELKVLIKYKEKQFRFKMLTNIYSTHNLGSPDSNLWNYPYVVIKNNDYNELMELLLKQESNKKIFEEFESLIPNMSIYFDSINICFKNNANYSLIIKKPYD